MIRCTLFISVLTVFFLTSCQDPGTFDIEDLSTKSYSPVFGIEDFQEAKDVLGNYILFGVYTDFVLKMEVSRDRNIGPVPSILLSDSRTMNPVRDVRINDLIHYTRENNSNRYETNIKSDEILKIVEDSFFGSENLIEMTEDHQNQLVDLYVPKAIELTSISNQGNSSNYYHAYNMDVSDFDFQWNKDERNENGVLLNFSWDEVDQNAGIVRHEKSIVVDDTGKATLSPSFFSEIPQNILVNFNLIRANFKITKGQNIKTYGISLDKRMIVLSDLN